MMDIILAADRGSHQVHASDSTYYNYPCEKGNPGSRYHTFFFLPSPITSFAYAFSRRPNRSTCVYNNWMYYRE